MADEPEIIDLLADNGGTIGWVLPLDCHKV
jgi:hypothetical protein